MSFFSDRSLSPTTCRSFPYRKNEQEKMGEGNNSKIVSPLVGFEITSTIMRKEFDLKSDAVTETGKVVAGDDIKLLLNILLIQ